MSTPTPPPKPPSTCACGHGSDHEHTVEDPVYKGMDYVWMLLGVSSRPVPYAKKCALCGHVFSISGPRRPW